MTSQTVQLYQIPLIFGYGIIIRVHIEKNIELYTGPIILVIRESRIELYPSPY